MYTTNKQLPTAVRDKLPDQAQTIYRKTFNSAWDHYKDPEDRESGSREEVAHKVAWSSVKQSYHKDEEDHWDKRSNL